MTCTPSPRPPRSQWLTNVMLWDATAFMADSPSSSPHGTVRASARVSRNAGAVVVDPPDYAIVPRRAMASSLLHLCRLQPATQKELPDAGVGENFFRAIGEPRAPELQNDAFVGALQRALGVLLDQQHRNP